MLNPGKKSELCSGARNLSNLPGLNVNEEQFVEEKDSFYYLAAVGTAGRPINIYICTE
jgi:hypothetical protein